MAEDTKGQGGTPGEQDAGKGSPTGQELVVKVGEEEKVVTAEEVAKLLGAQATATQKAQQAAAVLKAAEKYGLDPETYVAQAEGSFARFAELIDEGILDTDGQLIKKGGEKGGSPAGPTPSVPPKGTPSELKFQETAMKALETINKRLSMVEEDQTSLIRLDIERELKRRHPDLDEDDVSRLFGQVNADRERGKQTTIWDRAKELSERKTGLVQQLREKHAKEFGIDLDKWEQRNKQKEQSAEGGVAAFLKGKKISFRKGKDTVTPREAIAAWEEGQTGG